MKLCGLKILAKRFVELWTDIAGEVINISLNKYIYKGTDSIIRNKGK